MAKKPNKLLYLLEPKSELLDTDIIPVSLDEEADLNKIDIGTVQSKIISAASTSFMSKTNPVGSGSLSVGAETTASGLNAVALGNSTKSVGAGSFAAGQGTTANQNYQTVIGKYNTPDTADQHAFIIGNGSVNDSSNAFTVGWDGSVEAAGDMTVNYSGTSYNVGEWLSTATLPAVTTADETKVLQVNASGVWTPSTLNLDYLDNVNPAGTGSLQLGSSCVASGDNSVAVGSGTTASGTGAVAEGGNTLASGGNSHAGGFGTIADADNQTAIGRYNSTVADALFIVGNGSTDASRSNAFYVTTAGDSELAGDITIHYQGTAIDVGQALVENSGDYMNRVNPVGEGLFKMNTTSTLSTAYKDNYIFGSSSDILNVLDGTVSTAVEGNKIFGSNNILSLATRYPSTAFSDEGAPTTATKAHNTTIIGTGNKLTLPQPTSASGHTSVDSSNNTIIGEGISIDATDYSSFSNNMFIGSGGYLKPVTPAANAQYNIFLNANNGFGGTAQRMMYNIVGGAFNNACVTTAEYNVILADNSYLGASGSSVRLEHNNIFGSQHGIYGTTATYSTIMGHGHAIYYANNLTHTTIEGNAIVVSPDPSKESSGVANSGPYCGGHFEGYHHYIGYSSSAREGWHVEGAYNKVYPSVNQNYSTGLHIEGLYNALNNGSTVYCGHIGGYYNELNYGSALGHGSKLEGSNNKITGSGQVLNGSIMNGISNTLQNGSTVDYGSQINGCYNVIQNSTRLQGSKIDGYQSTVQMFNSGIGIHIGGAYNLIQGINGNAYNLSVDGLNTTVQGAYIIEGSRVTGKQVLVSMSSGQEISGSHIEGQFNKIYGKRNLSGVHIEGASSTVYNDSPNSNGLHIEGYSHELYLWDTYGAHIEGKYHYIGNSTAYTYFDAGHIEGSDNYVSSATTAVHVEGANNHIDGATTAVHVEGFHNYIIGDIKATHVEGYSTTASGDCSHTEGYDTIASGSYSHAGGSHTIANQNSQTVIGTYNTTSTDALFIVGNGTSTATSNALEVNKDGSANLQGDLTVHYNNTAYNVGQSLATGTLPAVTSSDAGSMLIVDANGNWATTVVANAATSSF